MRKGILPTFLFLALSFAGFAQLGGSHTYSFLELPQSARVAGLGGYQTTVKDGDILLLNQNPALLDSNMHQHMAFTFTNFYGGVNYGNFSYAHSFKKVGMIGFNINYSDYGQFDQTDNAGEVIGSFSAGETALNVAWSRKLNHYFHIGVNAKAIYSQLANYNSFGLAADLGVLFHDPKTNWSVGLVMRNAGGQLKPYTSGNREKLPLNLSLAVSHRLKYVPLRLTMTIRDLQQPDLTYRDPTNSGPDVDPLTGETIEYKTNVGDAIMRHFVFSAEVYITKNIYANLAYNYGRRQELKVATKPGTVGLSWGVGFRVHRFHISYARATYHQAGGTNHISIRTHLGKHVKPVRKAKKKKEKKKSSNETNG